MQTMDSAARPAIDVRELILGLLHERPYRPAELFENANARDVTETRLKDALAMLINENIVELSPERYIRLRS